MPLVFCNMIKDNCIYGIVNIKNCLIIAMQVHLYFFIEI